MERRLSREDLARTIGGSLTTSQSEVIDNLIEMNRTGATLTEMLDTANEFDSNVGRLQSIDMEKVKAFLRQSLPKDSGDGFDRQKFSYRE
jgi:hypothetical protein